MINGATVNSFTLNGAGRQLILAYADIQCSLEISAVSHNVVPASAEIGIELKLDPDGKRWPLGFIEAEIALEVEASPVQRHNAEADCSFEITLQPASVFAVFAHFLVEFDCEFMANGILADADIDLEIGLDPPAAIKTISAEAEINTAFEIDKTDWLLTAGAEALIEATFRCFFAPDLGNIKNSGAEFELEFEIVPSAIVSPRLVSLEMYFDAEIDSIASRASYCEIDTAFVFEATGTRVYPASADIAVELEIDAIPLTITPGIAELNISFEIEPDGFHEAFAEADCEISVEMSPLASFIFHVFVNMLTQFELMPSPILDARADSDVTFEIIPDIDPELVLLAEQGIVDFRTEFILSGICHLLFLAYAVSELSIDITFAEGIIGAYEPADECRTIYIEPDFNVLFVPEEERELRIAC